MCRGWRIHDGEVDTSLAEGAKYVGQGPTVEASKPRGFSLSSGEPAREGGLRVAVDYSD